MQVRMLVVLSAMVGVIAAPPVAFSQAIIGPGGSIVNPEPVKDAFQTHYAANTNIGDSVINISNSGALGASLFGPGFGGPQGNICVNVYAFDASEQELACCACLVTPNALVSLSINKDVISNTLTGIVPTSVMVKLLATIPGTTKQPAGTTSGGSFTGTLCNPGLPFGPANMAPGMTAWATTLHALPTTPVTYGVTETAFSEKYLSPGELASITSRCASTQNNGSGFGICRACRLGAL